MNIETKDWVALKDHMPGAPSFRTYGTVTVAHPGITAKLEFSPLQDKTTNLRLNLVLERSDGIYPQVETDKFVEYKSLGTSQVTGVSIFYEGQLVHHISQVVTVC
jgi:hypothetical protein